MPSYGGAGRDRTDDLLLAKQALSQLSYSPFRFATLRCLGPRVLNMYTSDPRASIDSRPPCLGKRRFLAPCPARFSLRPTLRFLVGLDGFEPSTPALSRRCSNQLSYRPVVRRHAAAVKLLRSRAATDRLWVLTLGIFPRKEVIQPHLPIRLPCYDFTPVTKRTVVSGLLAVSLPTSGTSRSHGVTGGVYKTRERIHRDMLIRDY